jgi:hypothetical protein
MSSIQRKFAPILRLLYLALFAAPNLASAHYDPGVQRWINRDPVQEHGGGHLYRFVGNNPGAWIDACGLGLLDPGGPVLTEIDLLCACRGMILEKTKEAEDWANTNYGGAGAMHSKEGSPADMLTHCVASCELARNEGVCLAAGYDVRKHWQAREGDHTRGGDKMDYENNRIGFAIADAGMDCKQGCIQAFVEGWLWTISQVPPHRAHPKRHPPRVNPAPPTP